MTRSQLLMERLDPGDSASEHAHQAAFVSWFRKTYPCSVIFAIPNGGHRGKAQAGRLKAEGVLAGVWDLFWMDEDTFIEFKTVRGRLSKRQIEFGESAETRDYELIVAYGFRDAVEQITGEARPWRSRQSA